MGLSMSTVARVLRRQSPGAARSAARRQLLRLGSVRPPVALGLGRFHRLGHRVTRNRHIDSPGAGWEYVHVAINDASR